MNIFGDQTIKVGDLAMVVRDCCGRYLGTPLRVAMVSSVTAPIEVVCGHCQSAYSNILVVTINGSHRIRHAPLFWLKKIDPPAIPEESDHLEEMSA